MASKNKTDIYDLLALMKDQERLLYGTGMETLPLGNMVRKKDFDSFVAEMNSSASPNLEKIRKDPASRPKEDEKQYFLDLYTLLSKSPLTALGANASYVNNEGRVTQPGLHNLFVAEEDTPMSASGTFNTRSRNIGLFSREHPDVAPHEMVHSGIAALKDIYNRNFLEDYTAPLPQPPSSEDSKYSGPEGRKRLRADNAEWDRILTLRDPYMEEKLAERTTTDPPFDMPYRQNSDDRIHKRYNPAKADVERLELLNMLAAEEFKKRRPGGPR